MVSTKPPVLTAATTNPHKLREFRRLFPGFRILSPEQIDWAFSFEETGTTYLENALGKATPPVMDLRMASSPISNGMPICSIGRHPSAIELVSSCAA
jgi:hypothetical protein